MSKKDLTQLRRIGPDLSVSMAERVKPMRHKDARNIRRGATLLVRFGQGWLP